MEQKTYVGRFSGNVHELGTELDKFLSSIYDDISLSCFKHENNTVFHYVDKGGSGESAIIQYFVFPRKDGMNLMLSYFASKKTECDKRLHDIASDLGIDILATTQEHEEFLDHILEHMHPSNSL